MLLYRDTSNKYQEALLKRLVQQRSYYLYYPSA